MCRAEVSREKERRACTLEDCCHVMSNEVNGQWRLHSRPDGMVKPSNFEFVEEPVPEPTDGEVLIRWESPPGLCWPS